MNCADQRVNIEGHTFNVRVCGEGPAILMLHGFTGAIETMQGLADYFSKDYQLISIDLPGHGRSSISMNQQDYSMSGTAERVFMLLDYLGVHTTRIIAYSMGGRLALYMVAHYSQRVAALATIGASAGLQSESERAQRREDDEVFARMLEKQDMESFVDHWMRRPLFSSQQQLGVDIVSKARQQRLRNDPQGLLFSLRGMGLGQQPPLQESLAKSSVAMLLLAGENDPKFCRIAEQIAKQCSSAQWAVVKSAGHAVHLEAKEACCLLIDDFFASQRRKAL